MHTRTQKKEILKELERIKESIGKEVEYTMDEVDDHIFQRLKKKYLWVTEDDYELVMDRLEKEYHFIKRIAMTKVKEEEELPNECNVCGEEETSNENFLVFCDGCNLGVHQSCYGVPNIPEGSWLCRVCFLSPNKKISCVLCPNPGGAYKKTTTGMWCHVVCGFLVSGARFENFSFLEPIDLEDVIKSGYQCYICSSKKGALASCAYQNCRKSYHSTCAINANYYIDMGNYITYCSEHDPKKKIDEKIRIDSPDTNYPSLQHTPVIRKNVPLWIPKSRTLSIIENLQPKILHYTVNRIAYRDLQGRPGATNFIKEMYSVWFYRRKESPIIKNLRLDTKPDGFKNWGEFRPCLPLELNEQSLLLLQEYSLPPTISYPFKDLYLYNLLILGTDTLSKHLKTIRELTESVKTSIRLTEYNKTELLKKHITGYEEINILLKQVKATDKHLFFKEQVTDDIAPGYSTIITNPQCIDTIEEKIKNLKYKSLSEVLKDLKTMIENAYKYNDRSSFIGIEASRIQKIIEQWKVGPNDIVLARIAPLPFLPYMVISSTEQKNLPIDCILIQSILNKEQHTIERSRIEILPPKEEESLILLNNLNESTPTSESDKKMQRSILQHVYKTQRFHLKA